MHQVCCGCSVEYGVKPPSGDRVTRSMCIRSLPNEVGKIRMEMAALKALPTGWVKKIHTPYSQYRVKPLLPHSAACVELPAQGKKGRNEEAAKIANQVLFYLKKDKEG